MDQRGVELTSEELLEAVQQGAFVWKTADQRFYTLDRLSDDHLCSIEMHLMGRSQYDLKITPDNPRWQETYTIIRDEIERRGLEPFGIPSA